MPRAYKLRSAAARNAVGRARRSELGQLAGDAFYVSIWQGSATVSELVQIALITHVLGLEEYGRLALVVAFVTIIGAFVRVRVGYTAVSFGASALDTNRTTAAGIFQCCGLVDLVTGAAGFLIVAVLAPVLGPGLVGDESVDLLPLFALTLLVGFPEETSTAVLRLFDRFRLVAIYSVVIDACRVAALILVVLVFESLTAVVVVLILGKLARGSVGATLSIRVFNRSSADVRLGTPAFRTIPSEERRGMWRMLFHTNFISYGRLAQQQLPTLLLGALAGPVQTGLYKLGSAVGATLAKAIDPASAALLPRLARLWSGGDIGAVRRVVRKTSMISIPAMLVLLTGLVVFRDPVLRLLGGDDAAAAGTILILAATAQALYGAVFWHTTVLLAARRAGVISAVTLAAGAVQIAALLILVPEEGATGAAIALLVSQALTNVVLAFLALRVIEVEHLATARGSPSLPTRAT